MLQLEINARQDPTRTTTLRRRYEADMVRRFKRIKRLIKELIVDQDALSLQTALFKTNAPFDFPRSAQKVSAFMRWLQRQTDFYILEGTSIENATSRSWQNVYIGSAYQRGLASASDVLIDRGAIVQPTYVDAGFFRPVHADAAGLIYTRAYAELEGVTAAMSTKMSQALSRSMIEGKGVRAVARDLLAVVDSIGITRARMIARTEVINAHAEATLNAYLEAGLEDVEVLAEFTTAGDSKVCPRCRELEGRVYKISEARGLIPVHPNCRCAWLPIVEDASGVVLS